MRLCLGLFFMCALSLAITEDSEDLGRTELRIRTAKEEDATNKADMQGTYDELPKEMLKYVESGKNVAACNIYAKEIITTDMAPTFPGVIKGFFKQGAKLATYTACAATETGLNIYMSLKFRKNGLPVERTLHKWFKGTDNTSAFDIHSVIAPGNLNACARLGGPWQITKNVRFRGPMFCLTGDAAFLNFLILPVPIGELGESKVMALNSPVVGNEELLDMTLPSLASPFGKVSVEVIGQMELNTGAGWNEALVFTLWLKIFPTVIQLRGGMQGTVCDMFFPGWCFGRLQIEAGVTGPALTFIGGGARLGIGSGCKEIMKGKKSDKKCTHGSLYFGINALDPTGSYISANLPAFTAGDMVDFLAPWANTKPIKSTMESIGFPKGIYFSHAMQRHNFMWGSIPMGTFICGTFMFLGYKGELMGRYSGFNMFVNAKLDPIKLGSLVTITRSIEDHRNGPIFRIAATRPKNENNPASDTGAIGVVPDVHIEGSLNILGMKRYAKIVINGDGLIFFLEGHIFGGQFKAKIKFTGVLPGPMQIKNEGFKALLRIKISFHAVIATGGIVDTFKKGVHGVIRNMKRLVNAMKKAHKKMKRLLKKIGLGTRSMEEDADEVYRMDEMRARLGESHGHKFGFVKKAYKGAKKIAKKSVNFVKRGLKKALNAAKRSFQMAARGAKNMVSLLKNIAIHGPEYLFRVCGAEIAAEVSTAPSFLTSLNFLVNGRNVDVKWRIWMMDPVKTLRKNWKSLKRMLINTVKSVTGRGTDKCELDSKFQKSGGKGELGESSDDEERVDASKWPIPEASRSEKNVVPEFTPVRIPPPDKLKTFNEKENPKPKPVPWNKNGKAENINKIKKLAKKKMKKFDKDHEKDDETLAEEYAKVSAVVTPRELKKPRMRSVAKKAFKKITGAPTKEMKQEKRRRKSERRGKLAKQRKKEKRRRKSERRRKLAKQRKKEKRLRKSERRSKKTSKAKSSSQELKRSYMAGFHAGTEQCPK